MPRIPKPSHELQRRNKESQFVGVADIASGVKAPVIPRAESAEWCASARRWWRSVRGSEQARTYTETDWLVALRCVALTNIIDAEVRGEGYTPAARHATSELRQLEDRLLVTVAARRRARVDLPGGGKAGGDRRPATATPGGGKVVDYREALGARAAGGE